MRGKRWWKSKTLWVNVLSIAGGLLGSKALDGVLSPSDVLIASGVVNATLRVITKEKLVVGNGEVDPRFIP